MAKRPNDPTLSALSKEAADLPFPFRCPTTLERGIMHWPSGHGMYAFLRIKGHTFTLGSFPASKYGAAQQFADACRYWFKPYLRARPSVESPEAVYNFSEAEAQLALSTVPGLEDLLCRLENHLRAEHDAGRPGLIDRDAAAAEREQKQAIRRSPSRQTAAQLTALAACLGEMRESVTHLSAGIASLRDELAAQRVLIQSMDLILRKQYAAS